MSAPVTNMGSDWERKNSMWIIPAFFTLGFASLLYIGYKTKQKKWLIAGAVYAVSIAIVYFIEGMFNPSSSGGGTLHTIYSFFLMASYVVPIVHSFIARKEYLLRLEALQMAGDPLRARISSEYGVNSSSPGPVVINRQANTGYNNGQSNPVSSQTRQSPQRAPEPIHTESTPAKVPVYPTAGVSKTDINNCNESEIAALPGVNSIMAKKAIAYRYENKGFRSLDEFFEILQLKPHFVIQIRDKAFCGDYQGNVSSAAAASSRKPADETGSGGKDRRLDI